MNAARLVASPTTTEDELKLFVGGLPAWDTVYLHRSAAGRRSVWHLAKGLGWPGEVGAPPLYQVVARIVVPDAIPEVGRSGLWHVVSSKAMVMVKDPRSLARGRIRRQELAEFILMEIDAGALPNRAEWIRRNQPYGPDESPPMGPYA